MNETASLLLNCESNGIAPIYDNKVNGIVELETDVQEILIISDTHIGAGLGPAYTYSGTENFFADSAFKRFLGYYNTKETKSMFIINGDFIDFIRIATIPKSEQEFIAWFDALQSIGVSSPKSIAHLKGSIKVERKEGYGLKTNDFKSVWKLLVASYGHPFVFEALAEWIGSGNEIVILKGNHDLEWYWLAVRNYFRYILALHLARTRGNSVQNILRQMVLPNIKFIDNAIIINRKLYVEHGHHYDNFTRVCPENKPTYRKRELNLPFGSFFNRYLLNNIELRYPYFENIRPRMSLLPMLIKKDFPLAVKVFLRYIPFLLKTLGKKRYWPMILQVFSFAITILGPIVVFVFILIFQFKDYMIPFFNHLFAPGPSRGGFLDMITQKLVVLAGDASLLILSYFLSRLISMLQLSEPERLTEFAQKIIHNPESKYSALSIVTFGHTHNPEQIVTPDDKWYYNTGTWIPVIEVSNAAVRKDMTYSFLKFQSRQGNIIPAPLLRWNDDACREEELVLVVPGDNTPGSKVRKEVKSLINMARRLFAGKQQE